MKTKLFASLLIPLAFAAALLVFSPPACTSADRQSAATKIAADISSPAAQAAFDAASNILGKIAVAGLTQVVQKETAVAGTGQGNAAASVLWSLASSEITSGQAQSVITSATNGALKETAQYVASVLSSNSGSTNKPAVINAAATVISTASGAPPANPVQSIAGIRFQNDVNRVGIPYDPKRGAQYAVIFL